MSHSHGKKAAFFQRGATAIGRYLSTNEFYVCPICLRPFPVSAIGELTLEHVPPKGLQGRELLLTCKACNSRSGHTMDAALVIREEHRKFTELVTGEQTDYRARAKWIVDGRTLNVEVYRDGKFVTIAGIPKLNDPSVVEYMKEPRNLSGRIQSRLRYHRRWVEIGDLRTAYLAALALFGYRYAFHSVFNSIRAQIVDPDAKLISGCAISLDPEIEVTRRIFQLSSPYPAILVQIDRKGVFLPIPGVSDDLYSALARDHAVDRRIEMKGDLCGWPTSLELTEDFAETSCLPLPSLSIVADDR